MRAVTEKRKRGKGQIQHFGLNNILAQIEYFIIRLLLIGLLLITAYDLFVKQAQLSRLCY